MRGERLEGRYVSWWGRDADRECARKERGGGLAGRTGKVAEYTGCTPERVAKSKTLIAKLQKANQAHAFRRICVDEAHCCAAQGHDFRPDYRRIKNLIQQSFTNIPVVGTTATANDRVVEDVEEQYEQLINSNGVGDCLIFKGIKNG